eukprot:scaffold344467_cov17-Prasinocladus_malaysianus.AAC.1
MSSASLQAHQIRQSRDDKYSMRRMASIKRHGVVTATHLIILIMLGSLAYSWSVNSRLLDHDLIPLKFAESIPNGYEGCSRDPAICQTRIEIMTR